MTDENNTDEALKADVSQNDVESPATEAEGMEIINGPISEEMREEARPSDTEGEQPESESTEEEEVEAEPEKSPEVKSRKTAESRIRELNADKKRAEEKSESLAEQIRKLTSNRGEPTYVPPQQEGDEITVDDLMRRSQAQIDIALAVERNVNRVNNEALEATTAYPELNPDSDSFDPVLSEKVSKNVLRLVQSNPTASVKEFVADYMEPIRQAVEKREVGQKETITKQVSQQATRPTSVQQQEKPFAELSTQEMEKKLGVVYR